MHFCLEILTVRFINKDNLILQIYTQSLPGRLLKQEVVRQGNELGTKSANFTAVKTAKYLGLRNGTSRAKIWTGIG